MGRKLILSLFLFLLLAAGCRGDDPTVTPVQLIIPPTETAVPPAADTPLPPATETAPMTLTVTATSTLTPTVTETPAASMPASESGAPKEDPPGDIVATALPAMLPSVMPEIPALPEIPVLPEVPIPEIPLPGG